MATNDTSVKLSLAAFCKGIEVKGKNGKMLLLEDVLRELSLQMYEAVTETWHFIHLVMNDQSEIAAAAGGNITVADDDEPVWNVNRVMKYMYVATRGGARTRTKLDAELLAKRIRLYDPLRLHLPAAQRLVSRSGLPANSLREAATRMAAAINTNIRVHWYKRQQRYIAVRDGLDMKIAKVKQQQINAAADAATAAAAAGQQQLDDSLPLKLLKSVALDLETHPQRFLYPMWRMNKLFEEKGMHLFAVLPMAHGFIPGACLHIDTRSLVAIVGYGHPALTEYKKHRKQRLADNKEQHKKRPPPGRDMSKEAMDEKDLVWSAMFNLKRAVRKPTQFRRFGHHITTDGASVSVCVAHLASTQPQLKKQKTTTHSQTMIAAPQQQQLRGFVQSHPLRVVGADPGKRNLLFLTSQSATANEGGKKKKKKKEMEGCNLRYSSAQRRHESGAPWRERRLRKKMPHDVLEQQEALSKHNSRTSSLVKFQEYLKARFAVLAKQIAHYYNPRYRIVRWHNWRDRRASEDRFAQRVLTTFGAAAAAAVPPPPQPLPQVPSPAPRVIVAYGDGTGFHALRHSAPSPTTGLRRRLRAKAHQGLVVIDTPEPGTSKYCARCHGELKEDPTRTRTRRRVVDEEVQLQEKVPLWGIRRCNSATCGGLRWNRDHNAAINIRNNLLHYLESGTWPPPPPPPPPSKPSATGLA